MFEQGKVLNAYGDVVFSHVSRPIGFFSRTRGLLGKSEILEGEAMWFDKCCCVHTIGMKFPIDVIHLGASGEILRINNNVEPYSHSILASSKSVLEIAEGSAVRNGLCPGDQLRFEL